MRIIASLGAGVLALGLAMSAAQAMPVAPSDSFTTPGAIVQVSGGCGPFRHRGPFGGCRPNGYRRPFVGGPYLGRPLVRRCFIRPTIYGPRRVCRF